MSTGLAAGLDKLERVWTQRAGYLACAHDERSGFGVGLTAAARGGDNRRRRSVKAIVEIGCVCMFVMYENKG